MKLSTKGRYGVKAMVELAVNFGKAPVSIKVISARQKISEYYLEQLFSPLRKANLIISTRGARGGYNLSRKPEDITVADIINILEGPIEISDCIEDDDCSNVESCATRLLWKKLKDSIDNVMESVTLQDIVDDYNIINNENQKIKLISRGEE